MNAESLGFTGHHGPPETWCVGCGNPESSGEHGMDCTETQRGASEKVER